MEGLAGTSRAIRPESPEPAALKEDMIVHQDSYLKVIVRREAYKKNRLFEYHDHQYFLQFIKKVSTRPDLALFSAMRLIEKSVTSVLWILKGYYTRRRAAKSKHASNRR